MITLPSDIPDIIESLNIMEMKMEGYIYVFNEQPTELTTSASVNNLFKARTLKEMLDATRAMEMKWQGVVPIEEEVPEWI